LADGCGGTLDCGSCGATQTCGGGGVTNVCGGYAEPTTPVCTDNGWCWENPLPQGNTLRGAWSLPSGDNWVSGGGGAVLRWNGSQWTGKAGLAGGATLRGIWAASNADVWAVGDAGAIAHFDGNAWSTITAPTTSNLNGVWGASSTAIWAVGDQGTVLRYDGGAWTKLTLPAAAASASLRAVWGSSASDVWVAGYLIILHWDGNAWSTTSTTHSLNSIWGASATAIWAASSSGVLRYNGTSWNSSSSAKGYAVFGTSETDVWVSGSNSGTYHFDGLSWTSVPIYNDWGVGIHALTAAPGGDLLAVGDDGAMWRRVQSKWYFVTGGVHSLVPYSHQFGKLAAGSAADVWAFGSRNTTGSYNYGYIMKRTPSGWQHDLVTTQVSSISAGSASSASNAWAVGSSKAFVSTGSGWTSSSPGASCASIAAVSSSDVWAFGDDKTLHFNGSTWTPIPNPVGGTNIDLIASATRDPADVWAGGTGGTLLHWTGSAWTAIASGTTSTINDLSAPEASFALAATANGVRRWNGSAWVAAGLDTLGVLSIWASSSTNAWATTWYELYHFDGSTWTKTSLPLDGSIWPVHVRGSGAHVWVLTDSGAVLHRQ
jgi:hypothetical protein